MTIAKKEWKYEYDDNIDTSMDASNTEEIKKPENQEVLCSFDGGKRRWTETHQRKQKHNASWCAWCLFSYATIC